MARLAPMGNSLDMRDLRRCRYFVSCVAAMFDATRFERDVRCGITCFTRSHLTCMYFIYTPELMSTCVACLRGKFRLPIVLIWYLFLIFVRRQYVASTLRSRDVLLCPLRGLLLCFQGYMYYLLWDCVNLTEYFLKDIKKLRQATPRG